MLAETPTIVGVLHPRGRGSRNLRKPHIHAPTMPAAKNPAKNPPRLGIDLLPLEGKIQSCGFIEMDVLGNQEDAMTTDLLTTNDRQLSTIGAAQLDTNPAAVAIVAHC